MSSLARRWRRGGLKTRAAMVATALVATVCVVALLLGLIRFGQWYVDVKRAEARQSQLVQRYGFDPGEIISDAQFFNVNAMSRAEVQAFLESKGSALASMSFETTTRQADELCEAYRGGKSESAAAIIDKSARACGISQKVLLTVLQKEQQLVTSTSPTEFQLKAAMGLNCPDDADCDPDYAGFFNQVFGAAKRYRYYLNHEGEYGYHAGQLVAIRYHPDEACGASNVYIRNKATALLYIYTPYQPNEAALAAGSGEGDSCSSYGNRNFALIYEGWFTNPRD